MPHVIFFIISVREVTVVVMAMKHRSDYFSFSFHFELEFLRGVGHHPSHKTGDCIDYELERKHESEAGGEEMPVFLGVVVWVGVVMVTFVPIRGMDKV